MKPSRLIRLAAAALIAILGPMSANAGGGLPGSVVQGQIRPGWITETGSRMVALHLVLAPGWKTYWRAPGDAGIPPSFSWEGSRNLRGVTYHWPSPTVFTAFGMQSAGYKGELVLPIELHPVAPGEPIRLKGKIDLGVCETICVPAHLNVETLLEGAGSSDPTIHQALASRPTPSGRAGVERVDCDIAPSNDGVALHARIRMPRLSGEEIALVETGDPRNWVSEPEVTRDGADLLVQAQIIPPGGQPVALDRRGLRFTVIGGQSAVDIRGCSVN